jgi:hypothetical protein
LRVSAEAGTGCARSPRSSSESRGTLDALLAVMHARAPHPATDLYTFMVRSHQDLDAVYGQLLEAMEANSPDVCAIWTRFDHELLAHMEAE